MPSLEYSVLIRTFNSQRTLPETIASVAGQTWRPSNYVIVDSGSTDATLDAAPRGATIHRFVGPKFNYSEALNQGFEHITTDYALIISSHTLLENRQAMAFAIGLLSANEAIGACYFCLDGGDGITYELIDGRNFNGFNGLWNTCAVVRTALVRKRAFRPEVFAAEDQEWSKWLFDTEGRKVARISGGGMTYKNPIRSPMRKRLNENLAIALYVKPEMLGFPYIARVGYRIIRPVSTSRERLFNMRLLLGLVSCRLRRPLAQGMAFAPHGLAGKQPGRAS